MRSSLNKLRILKGLPGSGKTKLAMELVEKGWKRVNKDDLRAMIDGGKWSRENEQRIQEIEEQIVRDYIFDGYDVVVDSTNFAHEKRWEKVAQELGAVRPNGVQYEVEFLDVPLMVCIERDSKRGDKSVGSKVIYGMYEKYLKPKPVPWNPALKDCFIFDIDGTLAESDGRSPYDYSKVSTDKVNPYVAGIFRILKKSGGDDDTIIVMSGRNSICRKDTEKWLADNDLKPNFLYMRAEGDDRKDSIVKKELYEQHVKGKYNVLGVFDDRNQVVDLWRSLGLPCHQVNYGFF
jgi:predicted kinase